MDDMLYVNDKEYRLLKLLGKGKGGYSYLAQIGQEYVVVKQIHHEPCPYYQFGNKIEAEWNDYQRLQSIGIPMPELLDIDRAAERIVKEYGERDVSPEQRLKDKDKRRAAYYRFYTDMKWGHAQNYDITLNSGTLGIDKCVAIIKQLY